METSTQNTLKSKWNVWVHLNESDNWDDSTFHNIYSICTIDDFWKFYNNLPLFDFDRYRIYVMKDNSFPTLAHPTNVDGGLCSIRLKRDKIIDVFEQLSILLLNESFNQESDEINGISIFIKRDWGLTKIWNSNSQHTLIDNIPKYIEKKYNGTARYVKNSAEQVIS